MTNNTTPENPPALESLLQLLADRMEAYGVQSPNVAAVSLLFGEETPPLSDLSVLVQIPAVRELAEAVVYMRSADPEVTKRDALLLTRWYDAMEHLSNT